MIDGVVLADDVASGFAPDFLGPYVSLFSFPDSLVNGVKPHAALHAFQGQDEIGGVCHLGVQAHVDIACDDVPWGIVRLIGLQHHVPLFKLGPAIDVSHLILFNINYILITV